MLQVIYNHGRNDLQIIAEVATNQSLTIEQVLEIAGIDLDVWAEEQGFDNYDWEAIELHEKMDLNSFLESAEWTIEKLINKHEQKENIFDEQKQAYIGGWDTSRIINLQEQYKNILVDLYDSITVLENEQIASVLNDFYHQEVESF